MPLPLKHYYMIRHGETEANANRIMAGSTDSPLNEMGIQQAYEAKLVIEQLEIKPEIIVHSNLSRARDTATILNEALNIPMHEEPGLAEMHCGDWEGIPYEECESLLDEYPDTPNGETFSGFINRIRDAKKRSLEHFDDPVLFVCHGGVFRAAAQIYQLHIRGSANCHLHEFIPHSQQAEFPWKVYSYRYQTSLTKAEEDWINGIQSEKIPLSTEKA